MSQLGSGNNSGYRNGQIDTRQIFRNASAPFVAPDSDTRLDCEVINDSLSAIVDIQTVLGANPNGVFGSVAARLNQFLPGGGAVLGLITFTNTSTFTIPANVHHLGSPAVLAQLYDASVPAQAVDEGNFILTLDQTTYDMTVNLGTPMSGSLVMSDPAPQYFLSFTNQTTVTIAGNVHQLGTRGIIYAVYDAGTPAAQKIQPGTFRVHPTTLDVTVTFGIAQSGTILIAAPGPHFLFTFTNQTALTIPGTTHQLDTAAILFQLYDAQTPAAAFQPQTLTVDPVTFDIHVTFGIPTSGLLVLAASQELTGTDFEIRDGGIVDVTAVRTFSNIGNLYLQAGQGDHIILRDKTGNLTPMDINASTGRVGIGLTPGSYQLQLSQNSAAKPGNGFWDVFSDYRLKEVLDLFTDGLGIVQALRPVRFRYNGLGGMLVDGQEHIGVIAQDVEPFAPYMIGRTRGRLTPDSQETDLLTWNGQALVFVLVNSIQQLVAQLAAQQALITALQEAVRQLQSPGLSPEAAGTSGAEAPTARPDG